MVSGLGVEATWLDAGSRSYAKPWETVVKGFLRSQRLPQPVQAVVSHADIDHYNVLYAAANRGGLRRVYLGGGFEAADSESAAGRFLFSLRQRDIPMSMPKVGDVISLGGSVTLRILLAGVPASTEPNDQSLVGLLQTPGGRVLLTADIERDGIAALLAGGEDLRADVLVLPHHGAWAAQLPALLEAVGPRIVICSSRREPDGGARATQAADVFYRSLRKRYEYYTTAREGYLRIELLDGRITVTPYQSR